MFASSGENGSGFTFTERRIIRKIDLSIAFPIALRAHFIYFLMGVDLSNGNSVLPTSLRQAKRNTVLLWCIVCMIYTSYL